MTIVGAVVNATGDLNPLSLITLVPVIFVLAHVVPWIVDVHGLRSYPGPWLAKFSDAWLGWVAAHGHRSEVVHELHRKYGVYTICNDSPA